MDTDNKKSVIFVTMEINCKYRHNEDINYNLCIKPKSNLKFIL